LIKHTILNIRNMVQSSNIKTVTINVVLSLITECVVFMGR